MHEAVTSQGRPLDATTRSFFEARHGQELGDIRLHTGEAAAASAAAVGANAYAVGRHIAFAPNMYQPESTAGRSLLAHEIAHVAEGARGAAGLQKDDKKEDAPISAASMVGLPAGAKVIVTRSMADWIFALVDSQRPDVAASLGAVANQRATISVADEKTVELKFDAPANIPAAGDKPAMTISDLSIRLARDDAGLFDFSVSGKVGAATTPLYEESGLTPRAENGKFILSLGADPHLQLTPAGSATGQAHIEAFTAAYAAGVPNFLKSRIPQNVGLIDVQGLPSAPEASKEADDVAKRAITKAAKQNAPPPRSTLTAGVGFARGFNGSGIDPLITATYRYVLKPTDYGDFVQVPLQLDVLYSPSNAVIGAFSSGYGASLAGLDIPVNVRVTAGVGAGAAVTPPPKDSKEDTGPVAPVFGPTLGLAAGYQAKWFRIEVRGDVLFNVIPGPAHTVMPAGTLGLGGSF